MTDHDVVIDDIDDDVSGRKLIMMYFIYMFIMRKIIICDILFSIHLCRLKKKDLSEKRKK